MKIYEVVLLAMAVFGSSWGDKKAGGDCPIEDEFMIENTLVQMAIKCLVPGEGGGPEVDFLTNPDAVDEARDFFKNYCQHYSKPVAKCLDQVKGYWDKCHEEEERHDFGLIRDFFETTLEVVCFEDGESLVKMFLELQPNPEFPGQHEGLQSFLTNCMKDVNLDLLNGDAPLRERIFSAYGRLKALRMCFTNKGKNIFKSTKEVNSVIGKISQKMKCLHPKSKKFVLCSSLNWEGTDDRQCPGRFDNADQKHITQTLIDDGIQCFVPSPKDLGVDPEQITHEFFINYCENLTEVKHCLAEVTSSAKLCLSNKTRHKVFEVYQEMLETSLEIGCNKDGVQLATIFVANFDRSSSSGEFQDVVGECKDISMTKIKHVPEFDEQDAATMSLRMYQEVGAFEECITRDIQSESFREVAHTFINDVMNKIKCVHPKEGNSVRCKTIVDSF